MDNNTFELTNPQKSIWNTELYFNDSTINNICGTINIYESLNFDLLKKTLDIIIEKNDIFHAKFSIKDGVMFQSFDNIINSKIKIIELESSDNLGKLEQEIMLHKFNILNNDLFSICIFKYPDLTGGVIVNIHHIISDSWTLGLIAKQIVSIYNSLANNLDIDEHNYSYVDYINAEKNYIESSKFDKDKTFWDEYLKDLPDPITIPKKIGETSNLISSTAKRLTFELSTDFVSNLDAFCREEKISIFNFFMAIYSIYVGKINNSNDFIIGTPILNRVNQAQKNTMGMFINTIPVRINYNDTDEFSNFINSLSVSFTSIFRHQKYSYQYILEDLRKTNPKIPNLYNVLLSYQITKVSTDYDMKYSTNWNFNGNIGNDFDIHLFDLNDTGKINIAYDYNSSKYSDEDISCIHDRILYMISQVLENPTICIKDISITPTEELNKILELTKNNDACYPSSSTVVDLFEKQVIQTPNNIAIKYKNDSMTYDELNKKANQLARFLISKGISKNDVVAIRLNKSLEMVVGILGIIKAGACYLPINLAYPQERVSFMLKDSCAKIHLTNKEHLNELSIDIESFCIDITNNEIYNLDYSNINIEFSPDDLIYIIYTSGSTGTPKGVMLSHRNVVRLIKNDKFEFNFDDKDIWTMFHSMAFDFSVWEMYGCLLYGGKLILVPEDTSKDPAEFLKLLREEKVTVLNQTPTYFYNLLDRELLNTDNTLSIRYIIFGGEALKPNLLVPWKNKYPNTKLINMYGITETTVHVTFKELKQNDLLSPDSNIGKPIPTLNVYIMDKYSNILPYGVEGEMCVGGLGVCKGYLNRPELNKEKFIKNPYNQKEIIYRSADNAVLSKNGDLYYIGRIDKQVKIRGFRVELGEIETKLLTHPNISKCVVLPKNNSNTDSFLVAYIVPNKKIEISDLKLYISNLVPEYMVPNYFILLDKMPLTTNGKIDSKELDKIPLKSNSSSHYVGPRNDFEKDFTEIVQKTLNASKIGIDDNIIELGADSLTLMKITIQLLEKNYIVNIQDIYEHKTIRLISDNFQNPNDSSLNYLDLKEPLSYDFDEKFDNELLKIKNVLLTGSTGFLGSHILNELLENTSYNIYCIVRNKNNQTSEKRLLHKLKFYFGKDFSSYIGNRIKIIPADISLPNLGLDIKAYTGLGSKIDVAIHCAAVVDHYGDNTLFENINITGTKNIINFCKDFNIYMNHISTTSVSSYIPDSNKSVTFNEHNLYVGQNYYDNVYIKTKFGAEYDIWKEINNGMNISVYRLGNISARYSDGKFQENDDKNAFLNRILTLSKFEKLSKSIAEFSIDLSPVDICASIIATAIKYKSSYPKTFHIYNNHVLKLLDIINKINPSNNIEIVSDEEFYKYIKNKTDIMGIINDLTSNSSSYNSNIIMDNTFTINYMRNLNLKWPDVTEEYLNKYFKKYI